MSYFANPLIPLNLQKEKKIDPSQFATAEQGERADSALQNITGTGDEDITVTVSEKSGEVGAKTQNITVSLSQAFIQYIADLQSQIHYLQQFVPASMTDVATFHNLVSIQDATVIIFDYKDNQDTTGYDFLGYLDVNEDIAVWWRNGTEYLILSNFIISLPVSCKDMFKGAIHLVTLLFYNIDSTNTTSMQSMFQNCSALTNLNVSLFDTSKVISMVDTFNGCESLTSLDVSKFDTSKVISMYGMFKGCQLLSHLDVSKFDTSNVTSMRDMFSNCRLVQSLDVSNFNTSRVSDMQYMFAYCATITNLDVSSFDTSLVTNMSAMFQNCRALLNLDLSNFNTSRVSKIGAMFQNCYALQSVDVSSFDTSLVQYFDNMFNNCTSLVSLDASNFNTDNATSFYTMFASSGFISINVANFNTANVVRMHGMFRGCSSLITIIASNWILNPDLESNSMFFECPHLVGGNGTTYDYNHDDASYAHIDTAGNPGYFTAPSQP